MCDKYQNHMVWFKSSNEHVFITLKEFSTIVFSSKGNEIHTCATVKNKSEKVFRILYTLPHNIHDNRDAALGTSDIYTSLYKQNKYSFFWI